MSSESSTEADFIRELTKHQTVIVAICNINSFRNTTD